MMNISLSNLLVVKNTFKSYSADIDIALVTGKSKTVETFNNSDNFFDEYYKDNIDSNNNLINNTIIKSYNELGITKNNSLINLFVDIDVKKNELLDDQNDFNTIIKEFLNQNQKSEEILNETTIDLYLITTLIYDIVYYLLSYTNKFNFSFIDIESNEKYNLFKKDPSLDKIFNKILEYTTITKSTSEDKFSYHIYFNNLLFEISFIPSIKSILKAYKENKNIQHPFKQFIDIQIYHKNPSLRLPYCNKDINNFDYHYPLVIENNIVKPETAIFTKETFKNYFFTQHNTSNKIFILIEKNDLEDETKDYPILGENITASAILEDNEKNIINIEESPDLYFMTYSDLFNHIFSKNKIPKIEFFNYLDNIDLFQSNIYLKDTNIKEIFLKFDYEKYNSCQFCDKKFHKHNHKINFTKGGLTIIKEGYMSNCKIISKPYEPLSESKICEFIYKLGLVKRLKSNEIIVFTEKDGWSVITDSNISKLKYILYINAHYFKNSDRKTLENIKFGTLKEIFSSLSESEPPIDKLDENLFKFKNGILNMKTKIFTLMKDSKDLYIFSGVNYEYKHKEDFNSEDKIKFDTIFQTFNEILPILNNDQTENIHRKNFEINASTILFESLGKDVITIIIGQTKAGKSTMKEALISAIGSDNTSDIFINCYTEEMNPKTPNPWLAQLRNKKMSFASETDTNTVLLAINIKNLTETTIKARELRSNIGNHEIKATHFIDTNFDIKLDNNDLSGLRRILEVRFQSHFKDEDNTTVLLKDNTKLFDCKKKIKNDIIKGVYSLYIFHILLEWAEKHNHFQNGLKMVNSVSTNPICLLVDHIHNMTFPGRVIKEEYIKDDILKLSNNKFYSYQRIHTSSEDSIGIFGIKREYFFNYFNKIIKKKMWKVSLKDEIRYFSIGSGNKLFIPYVLIQDIKEEYFDKILKKCEKLKKKINMEYYYQNKDIHEDCLEEEYEDEENIF